MGDLERTSPYRPAQSQAKDLPSAEEAEEKAGGLARSPTIKTLGDDLEVALSPLPERMCSFQDILRVQIRIALGSMCQHHSNRLNRGGQAFF